MNLNVDLEISQSIIDEIPTSKLERHKELLFGLFLFTEDSEYTDIPPKIIKSKKRFLSPSEYAVEAMKNDSRHMASSLSSLPELIKSFSMDEKYKNNSADILSALTISKNVSNYSSSSADLKEVEGIGMMKFHKLIFPKLSSHDYQINQFQENVRQDKELHSPLRKKGLTKNKDALDDQVLNSQASVPIFSPFSIKFNECSLFAISHWAAKSSLSGEDSREKQDEVTREYYPAPDVLLRKCNICNLWGHYDIECDRMSKSDVIVFSNALRNQSIKSYGHKDRTREAQGTMNLKEFSDTQLECQNSANIRTEESNGNGQTLKACSICDKKIHYTSRLKCGKCENEFHIACVELSFTVFLKDSFTCSTCSEYEPIIDSNNIESCGKFVFEQSKNVLAKDFGRQSYVNDSRFFIGSELIEGRMDNTKLLRDESLLSPSDLCWAKRGNAVDGSLGSDRWWPGMVVSMFDTNESTRNQGQVRTSFVVRFFCCQGGGRVRATEVIPFIPNFDLIWNDRLSNPDEPDYIFFIKALKEASSVSNCSFPTDPSTPRTGTRKYARPISEISLTSSMGVSSNLVNDDEIIPSGWEDAEVSEQDGIVILAKSDEKVKSNTEENVSNSHDKAKNFTPGQVSTPNLKKSPQNNINVANSVNTFFKKAREEEDKSIHLTCLSLSKDQLLGSVVSWSILAINSNGTLDSSSSGVNHRSTIQYGRIVAASLSNSKALIRTITSANAMASFPPKMRTSICSTDVNNCNSTVWVPLKRLKLINSDPKNIPVDGARIGASARGIKRSINTNDTITYHQAKFIKNSESCGKKNDPLDGKWKREPNDRSSSTLSKTLSVADTLQKSLAKLAEGRSSGIYQAERILNDRTVKSGGNTSKQYLIKWEGVDEITWEPEDHIFDSNLLDVYHEKKKSNSTDKNNSKVEDSKNKGKYKKAKNLLCPFCGIRCKDGQSLGGHIRMHRNEPNYKEILNSGKLITAPTTPKENSNKNNSAVAVAVASSPAINIVKEFKCPFCHDDFKDGLSFGGHVRKHNNELNYREILDAAKSARDKTFETLSQA